MTDNLLSSLNDVQREAVQHTEGPLLILSGAGSGKTRVITHRVAYLIEHHNVSPYRILAVTFTNKAANEMKTRLETLLETGISKNLWVATFHSTCARILRQDIEKLEPYTGRFTIYDTGEQYTLIKGILRELGLNEKTHNPRAVLSHISRAKNDYLKPTEYADIAKGYFEETVAKVYPVYQETLRQNNALDFDDLLLFTLELFVNYPETLEYYQDKFAYLLVDEYQDTNQCQYELVRFLAGERQNICVVGDDDQSIYSFRGADIKNILNFEKDYPNTQVLRLEQNYRSTKNILDAAWSVVHNNKARKAKRLWTENEDGEHILCYEAADENDEAGYVGTQIQDWHEQGVDYADFAIFYRTNAQSRVFEEAFLAANIPYQIIGGVGFYDRMEVKDLLAYLRIMSNPHDTVSLRRIINVPTRGIGATTVQRLVDFAHSEDMSLFDAIKRVEDIPKINSGIQAKVRSFAKIFTEFGPEDLPTDAMHYVLGITGYLKNLKNQKTVEAQNRVENIEELMNAIAEYEYNAEQPSLANYLETVALTTDIDRMETDKTDRVPLMTLHSAKGLEFPFVFIVGMEENFLPHQRAITSLTGDELEEERRLCYVGITRAMEQLFLVHAQQRRMYRDSEYRSPSRFIEEIPPHLIKHVDRYRSAFRETAHPSHAEKQTHGYNIDQVVYHSKYGRGKITQLSGTGENTFVTVRFERAGIKEFATALAPLQIIEVGK